MNWYIDNEEKRKKRSVSPLKISDIVSSSFIFQDLEDDEFDVRKPKKQRRSIVRTPSITRVRDAK